MNESSRYGRLACFMEPFTYLPCAFASNGLGMYNRFNYSKLNTNVNQSEM